MILSRAAPTKQEQFVIEMDKVFAKQTPSMRRLWKLNKALLAECEDANALQKAMTKLVLPVAEVNKTTTAFETQMATIKAEKNALAAQKKRIEDQFDELDKKETLCLNCLADNAKTVNTALLEDSKTIAPPLDMDASPDFEQTGRATREITEEEKALLKDKGALRAEYYGRADPSFALSSRAGRGAAAGCHVNSSRGGSRRRRGVPRG